MKKYLFMLLAVVAVLFTATTFVSCGSDDDSPAIDISGTWVYESTSEIFTVTYNNTETFVFSSDGSFSYEMRKVPSTVFDAEDIIDQKYTGTYSVSGTKVTLNYKDQGTTYADITSHTSTTLTLNGKEFKKK